MLIKKYHLLTPALYLIYLFISQVEARKPDQVYFWPIKPFIYYNNNKLEGILPMLYSRLTELCSPYQNLSEFKLVNKNFLQNSFYNSVENASLGINSFQNNSISNAVWFPLLVNPDLRYLSTYKVKADIFMYTPSIGVIANSNKITITNKVFESIKQSSAIALHAGGLILIFSVLVSVAESKMNKDFNNFFIKGFGTGLWWAVVTLATVGYGDIVPKSLIGRFFSIIWMVIGVVLVSGMTGIFSSVMTTNSFLSIQNKKIAALDNSLEFLIAQKNYNTKYNKVYNSYEEVLQDVESNNVEYGVINIDVLLNMEYKTKYKNVVLVQLLDSTSPVVLAFGSETNLMANLYQFNIDKNDSVLTCLKNLNFKDILQNVQEMYKKIPSIETESAQTLDDFLKTNYIKYTLVAIFLTVLIFSMKDGLPLIYNSYKRHKQNKISTTSFPMNLVLNKHSNEETKSSPKNELHEELALINEQLIKLNNAILSKQCCPCSNQP